MEQAIECFAQLPLAIVGEDQLVPACGRMHVAHSCRARDMRPRPHALGDVSRVRNARFQRGALTHVAGHGAHGMRLERIASAESRRRVLQLREDRAPQPAPRTHRKPLGAHGQHRA